MAARAVVERHIVYSTYFRIAIYPLPRITYLSLLA